MRSNQSTRIHALPGRGALQTLIQMARNLSFTKLVVLSPRFFFVNTRQKSRNVFLKFQKKTTDIDHYA